ncbi:hypothetical protein [Microbacterium candidum]|uniref:Uncharacterized protein n=1 Tax=Microbacterium candidum TaxID=3041922 RepID=A0ABT7MYU1_9MICO|nr:hypothetical protein [Microbacterium sp. ASV49]MDL9979623.1 hypothetical protein [Microbacterium sp. ASV49]
MTNPPTTRREARLAAEAQASAPADQAVFVDPSGRRSRRARGVVAGVVGGVLLYVVFIAVAILGQSGVESPLLPHPPAPAAGSETNPSHSATPLPTAIAEDPVPLPSESAILHLIGTGAATHPSTAPTSVPVASPTPAPSPSATAPGRSGSAPSHTPKPKPTGKP